MRTAYSVPSHPVKGQQAASVTRIVLDLEEIQAGSDFWRWRREVPRSFKPGGDAGEAIPGQP